MKPGSELIVYDSRNCIRKSREHTATQHGSRSDRSVIPFDGNSSAFTAIIISPIDGGSDRTALAELRRFSEREARERSRRVGAGSSDLPGHSET